MSEVDIKTLKFGVFGTSDEAITVANKVLSPEQAYSIPMDLEKLLEFSLLPDTAFLVICEQGDVPMAELAQLLRAQYQDLPIFLTTTRRAGFQKEILQKNGFTDVFLLPFEEEVFERTLERRISDLASGKARLFRPVYVVDLKAGTKLSFDTFVYLPLNKKYIRLSSKGKAIEENQISRISQKQIQNLFVRNDEIKSFYKYTADQLRLAGKSGISETERREKQSQTVRGFLAGILSDNGQTNSVGSGMALVKDCQGIIANFVDQDSTQQNLITKIQALTGQASSSSYDRLATISAFAFLFSLGTNIGAPQDLAIAGLIHDLGISELPPEIQKRNLEDLAPAQLALYRKHPDLTVDIIRQRKMTVSESVITAIAQHHEKHGGTGYPRGLVGDKIAPESQLLSIAIHFTDLVSFVEGKQRFTPQQAIQHLIEVNRSEGLKKAFDPSILDRIAKILT